MPGKPVRISLRLTDSRLSEQIIHVARSSGIKVVVVNEKPDVVLADSESKVESELRYILVDRTTPLEEVVEWLKLLSRAPSETKRLVVGIDPGKRIGVAIVASNWLVDWQISNDAEEVVRRLRTVIKILRAKRVVIKVGRTADYLDIVKALKSAGFTDIRLANEEGTTRIRSCMGKGFAGIDGTKDKEVVAALMIALKT